MGYLTNLSSMVDREFLMDQRLPEEIVSDLDLLLFQVEAMMSVSIAMVDKRDFTIDERQSTMRSAMALLAMADRKLAAIGQIFQDQKAGAASQDRPA